MVAAGIANLQKGGDRKSDEIKGQICPLKIDDAAKQMNVSPKSVKNAKAVKDKGTPGLADMVRDGKVSARIIAIRLGSRKRTPHSAPSAFRSLDWMIIAWWLAMRLTRF